MIGVFLITYNEIDVMIQDIPAKLNIQIFGLDVTYPIQKNPKDNSIISIINVTCSFYFAILHEDNVCDGWDLNPGAVDYRVLWHCDTTLVRFKCRSVLAYHHKSISDQTNFDMAAKIVFPLHH